MNVIETKKYKLIELVILFIVVPTILAVNVASLLKLILVLFAVGYVVFVSKKLDFFNGFFLMQKSSKSFWIRVLVISIFIFLGGFLLIKMIDAQLLFKIVKTKPILWVIILFVYAFLSVIPQELLYRGYFFKRYLGVFKSNNILFLTNVFCFSYCHLFLKNYWVLLITAIGGVLFLYTHHKEKKLLPVIIEHSIYGNLIFTLGLGEMLAFPS